MFWIFLILNALAAILSVVIGILFNNYTYINKDDKKAKNLSNAFIAV